MIMMISIMGPMGIVGFCYRYVKISNDASSKRIVSSKLLFRSPICQFLKTHGEPQDENDRSDRRKELLAKPTLARK